MRESFVFYRSFYEAMNNFDSEIQSEILKMMCEYILNENEITSTNAISNSIFKLIKPQLDASDKRYYTSVENGKKGGRPKKEKPNKNLINNLNDNLTNNLNNNLNNEKLKPNQNLNDNDNVNVNDNDNRNSCEDEIVKFYENNIGSITPHEYELLNSYRDTFTDDVIIYALQLQIEKKIVGVSYAKTILNNWKKKNIKTLLDAKNENLKKDEKIVEIKNQYFNENNNIDLSKFYV